MNKPKYLLWVVSLLLCNTMYSQVGIGNASPKASLDVSIPDVNSPNASDGLLIPRMNTLPSTNPSSHQNAVMIYLNNDLSGVNVNGTPKDYHSGFYFWNNSKTDWMHVNQKNSWYTEGNANVISGTHFLGTTNAEEVDFRVNNKLVARLTELGQLELDSDGKSTFIGFEAGENYDPEGTSSEQNAFVGYQSGKLTSGGRDNVAVGALALTSNTTGNFNAVLGDEGLQNNTTGSFNTAVGNDALRDNIVGNNNTAVGRDALRQSTSATDNVAIGSSAMEGNNTSSFNVAVGRGALSSIDTGGGFNTAIGNSAGSVLASGFGNIYIGSGSGTTVANVDRSIAIGNVSKTNSSSTISIGHKSEATAEFGIAIGFESEAKSFNSMALGKRAITNGNNSIAIGNAAATTKVNQIVLGNTNITEVLTSGVLKADSFLATGSSTTYADYVFEDYYTGNSKIKKDYKFTDINTAETFVRENGHLPGVKSYAEVMKNGFSLDLTEATITNLEKIEEQFLYITELNKQIKKQEETITKQNLKMKALERRLEKIEKLLDE